MTEPPPKPRKPSYFQNGAAADGVKFKPRISSGSMDSGSNSPTARVAKSLSSALSVTPKETKRTAAGGGGRVFSGASSSLITIPEYVERVEEGSGDVFIEYKVRVRVGGKDHNVGHRFSEFDKFHKKWSGMFTTVDVSFPSKKYLSLALSSEELDSRRSDLEKYLQDVSQVSALRYDLAEFLDVSEKDLKDAISGKGSNRDSVQSDPGRSNNSSSALKKESSPGRAEEGDLPLGWGGAADASARPKSIRARPISRSQSPAPSETTPRARSQPPEDKPAPNVAAQPASTVRPSAAAVGKPQSTPAGRQGSPAQNALPPAKEPPGTTGISVAERMKMFQGKT